MQIQAAIESTDILTKELCKLKEEYYQDDDIFFKTIRTTKNVSNSRNKIRNTDKRSEITNLNYQYYKQLIYSVNKSYCITDKSGRVLECSEGLKDIICIDENKIIGNYIWNIYQYLPLKIDVQTIEMLKLREIFLSCILTKREYKIQNSKIFSFSKSNSKNRNVSISVSTTGNPEALVKIDFIKN